MKTNKKGVELSLQTIIVLIIVVIVVIVMIMFFSDQFLSNSQGISDTGNAVINGSYS